jgi:O-acetyl-ADP-ribose deacetylase (regulator of RNase III)
MKILYVDGNALECPTDNPTILVHCANTLGVFGAGIARSIAKKWPDVERKYKEFCQNKEPQQGQIQLVRAEHNLVVCNLFGQSGIGDYKGLPAVRYGAVHEGLLRLKDKIKVFLRKDNTNIKIVMPRICCNLAGGSWAEIEKIINTVFGDTDLEITVYDFGPYNP